MRIGILRISDEVLCGKTKEKTAEMITAGFFRQNIDVYELIICKITDAKNKIEELTCTCDSVLVVCDSNDLLKLKKQICEITQSKLVLNEFAKTGINAYYKKTGVSVPIDSDNKAFLPQNSRCILNLSGDNVGFVFKLNNKDIFVLPADFDEAKNMFYGSVLPLIAKTFGKSFYGVVIKTFAISENEISKLLSSLQNSAKLNVSIFNKGLVCEILIRYKSSLDKEIVNDIVSTIYEKIGKHIFTDEDKNLEDIVCDILSVQKRALTIFEDATFGSLSRCIFKSKSFEDFMLEKSEIISTDSIKEFLCDEKNSEEDFIKTVIQNNLTSNGVCLVNLKSKKEKNSYLIGIGKENDVDVYNIRLTGEESEIDQKLNQTSLFYLIKKLKQNHF